MRTDTDIYNFVTIDLDDLGSYADALHDIFLRRIDGLIIRNYYSKKDMGLIEERILTNTPPLHRQTLPWGETIGRTLVRSDPNCYFDIARQFRIDCQKLFEDIEPFEERFERIAGQLAGGRKIKIPTKNGEYYSPATIRTLRPRETLSAHCGNFFLAEESFAHLTTMVQVMDQLSYFVTVRAADAGGELALFDAEWPEIKTVEELRPDRDDTNMLVKTETGDLLFFDGGRIWHRVNCIEGETTRITLGGFAGFSKDDQDIYYWS